MLGYQKYKDYLFGIQVFYSKPKAELYCPLTIKEQLYSNISLFLPLCIVSEQVTKQSTYDMIVGGLGGAVGSVLAQ